jgi:hypothetical protein
MTGAGVMYHGSVTEAHGLYVVVGPDDRMPGRWVLYSPDTKNVLYRVRSKSFEVLIMTSADV